MIGKARSSQRRTLTTALFGDVGSTDADYGMGRGGGGRPRTLRSALFGDMLYDGDEESFGKAGKSAMRRHTRSFSGLGADQARQIPTTPESAQAQADQTGQGVADSSGVIHLPRQTLVGNKPPAGPVYDTPFGPENNPNAPPPYTVTDLPDDEGGGGAAIVGGLAILGLAMLSGTKGR